LCNREYQKVQGEMPLATACFYDPSNATRAAYETIDLNLDVYCWIAGLDAMSDWAMI
jgi:hypothetical protein